MKTKKVLKIVGIVLLVILVIALIYTFRNYKIISKLQAEAENYTNKQNYHIKSVTSTNDYTIKIDYYQKGNKQVCFMEREINGTKAKISMYNNGERIDTFTETEDAKKVKLNSAKIMEYSVYNVLKTDSNWQTFVYSFLARVKSVNYNNKECYSISNYLSPYYLDISEKNEIYIEKDTGLMLKQISKSKTNIREYEFDNVEESIFAEPDISQYTLQED